MIRLGLTEMQAEVARRAVTLIEDDLAPGACPRVVGRRLDLPPAAKGAFLVAVDVVEEIVADMGEDGRPARRLAVRVAQER